MPCTEIQLKTYSSIKLLYFVHQQLTTIIIILIIIIIIIIINHLFICRFRNIS